MPELCDVHRFPASLWRQTVWVPSIFHRLNSLLLADELRVEIQANTNLGSAILPTSTYLSSFSIAIQENSILFLLDEQWEPLRVNTNPASGRLKAEIVTGTENELVALSSALKYMDDKPNNFGHFSTQNQLPNSVL